MKIIKRFLIAQLLVLLTVAGFSHISFGVETDVDVGIDFTDIAKKPATKPKPKPPTKAVIKLPQTGESKTQRITFVGLGCLVVTGIVSLKRKDEVTKE